MLIQHSSYQIELPQILPSHCGGGGGGALGGLGMLGGGGGAGGAGTLGPSQKATLWALLPPTPRGTAAAFCPTTCWLGGVQERTKGGGSL